MKYDPEVIKHNLESVNRTRAILELEPEEMEKALNADEEYRMTTRDQIVSKMKEENDYPDNSQNEAAMAMYWPEYTDKITCPGCGEKILFSWLGGRNDEQCPLCHQKIIPDIYIT